MPSEVTSRYNLCSLSSPSEGCSNYEFSQHTNNIKNESKSKRKVEILQNIPGVLSLGETRKEE